MKNFDQRIDFLRVLSMCLVIVIHVSNYYCRAFTDISRASFFIALCFSALAKAAVPIFFMISGALLLSKPYDHKKHKDRTLKLFITLAIFTIVYYFWDKYFQKLDIEDFSALLFKPRREMLWFLYVIICLYISVPYVKLITDHMDEYLEKLFIKQWLLFNGVVYVLRFFIDTKPKYFVPIISGTYYLGYFIIGYLIIKYKDKIDYKKYNLYYILSIIFGVSILVGLSYFDSIAQNEYIEKYLNYKNLFTNIISISAFLLIYSNIKDKKYKIISFLSPYSFGVYLLHGMVTNVVMKYNGYKAHSSIYSIPISSICILLMTIPIVYLLKKVPIIKKYI